MNAIETHGLTKDYGNLVAVKDLDLTVKQGVVYGFLGPNGAGKSTTINMLMGFVRPTAGSASIMGFDVRTQHLEIKRSRATCRSGRPSMTTSAAGETSNTSAGSSASRNWTAGSGNC